MSQFSGWNETKLNDLKHQGKIRGYAHNQRKNITQERNKNIPPGVNQKRSEEKAWLGWNLTYWANERSVQLVPEHKFHPERKFRFDFCFPALKIAVEYEGIMSEKSRHTTVKGYSQDAQKYNLAQQLGWRVIRLTALDYRTVLQQLNAYVD
jgi:very-short-patch-repair endonuclease